MTEAEFKKKFIKRITETPWGRELDFSTGKARSDPDLVILGHCAWAALEFKKDKNASHQPNQDNKIRRLKKKCYASFIYPENEEKVFNELERLFGAGKHTCIPVPF